ncbi:MAG: PadR family transcriptional regulator [Lachnospiraceae bacterium]
MSLKHGLLGLLNYGSMTGYELNKAFKDSLSFFWKAQVSQVYRELDAMEKNGWLTSERVIQNEKPNKRVYSITDAGKEELNHWLLSSKQCIDDTMSVKSAFLMRMFFSGEIGNEYALSMLRAYREECLKNISEYDSISESIAQYEMFVNNKARTKYWEITALFGETACRANLEWANQAIALLEEDNK